MKKLLFVVLLVSLLLFTSCSTSNTNTETSDSTKNDISENKRTVNLNSEDPFPGYTREMFGKVDKEDELNLVVIKRWYLKIDDCLTNDYYAVASYTHENGKRIDVSHCGPYLTDENIELMRQSLPIINENINAFDEQTKRMYLELNPDVKDVTFNKYKYLIYDNEIVIPLIKYSPIIGDENIKVYLEFVYNAETKELIDETTLPRPNIEHIIVGE